MPSPTEVNKIIVDGDLFLYRSCSAIEFDCDWGDGVRVLSSNAEQAIDLFNQSMRLVTDKLHAEQVYVALNDSRNFRKELNPDYKSQRADMRKPLAFHELKKYVEENYEVITRPGLESDDVCGIIGTNPNTDIVIVSQDKDMMTLPCRLYRDGKIITVDQHTADWNFMKQTLTGDMTDGYKGCPGIGSVKADKIITQAMEETYLGKAPEGSSIIPYVWPFVVYAYENAGLTKEDALMNARMSRILRYEDWDKETQTVKLWSP